MIATLMDQKKSNSSDFLALSGLFVLALGLRLFRLFDLDIWFDEAALLLWLNKSFSEIWNLCKTDTYPPLFPWLLKGWSLIFGSEHSLRLFTAIFSSTIPPAAYLLGKTLKDRRLGWYLGLACVLSASLLHYGQIIRAYSPFPLFVCLSLTGFIRGLRNDNWKDWVLVATANLLGFYTFSFMAFVIAAEVLLLIWFYRQGFSKYLKPLWTHLPILALASIWIIPLLHRYGAVQDVFYNPSVKPADLVKLWVFIGTGIDFKNNYLLTFLLNLPFLAGVVLCIPLLRKSKEIFIVFASLIVPIVLVYLLSLRAYSIFVNKCFIFLPPVYLTLVLMGWSSLTRKAWRLIGLVSIFALLLVSACYYFYNYYDEHPEYNYIQAWGSPERYNGHAISETAAVLRQRLAPEEVIVHYSIPALRAFSFFPSIYYNQRSLPEYLYWPGEIPHYWGRQYLAPKEQIESLFKFDPLPPGLWMVTLDLIQLHNLQRDTTLVQEQGKRSNYNDLLFELLKGGYAATDTMQFGRVTLLHYLRQSE